MGTVQKRQHLFQTVFQEWRTLCRVSCANFAGEEDREMGMGRKANLVCLASFPGCTEYVRGCIGEAEVRERICAGAGALDSLECANLLSG